ncbi:hypothetical protein I7I48_06714 [Histoplasma ohiense]|nr:hypothetical protein I7I48_06714 [Histoplasma ohiense (nom. inval.)]
MTTDKKPSLGKRLSRNNPRSIHVPMAAFGMALVLGAYCITSIRRARRNARYSSLTPTNHNESSGSGRKN